MAYYLQLNGPKTFVHIPKTGGCWVERFLGALENVEGFSSVEKMPIDDEFRGHDIRHFRPLRGERDYLFTSVRHPVSWYESVWRYGMQTKIPSNRRHPLRPIASFIVEDFDFFVRNVIDYQPAFVTRLYEAFICPWWEEQYRIVRQESLAMDMRDLVREWGYEGPIPEVEPVNVSEHPRPTWDEGLKREVERMEIVAIRRFYG